MTLYNSKGKPVNLTFTDLLFTSFNAPTRRGAKSLSVSSITWIDGGVLQGLFRDFSRRFTDRKSPQFQKVPEPPKPVEVPPAAPPPAAPVAPEAAPPPPPPPPPFTATEDFVLMTMKSQNRTWKEICEYLPGRDKDTLIARYKELTKEEVVSAKGDAECNCGVGRKEKHSEKLKGILKEGKSPKPDDAPKVDIAEGSSVIEVGDGDMLSGPEVEYLVKLSNQYEDKKYSALASKIFDKTGKRIDPNILKAKFGGS